MSRIYVSKEEIDWLVERIDSPRIQTHGGGPAVYQIVGSKTMGGDTGFLVVATIDEDGNPRLLALAMSDVCEFFGEIDKRGDREETFETLYYEEDFFLEREG